MRENDEETYEEESATTSHFSSVGKKETAMAPTIVEVVTVSKISSERKLETAFALPTGEAIMTPKFLSKEEQGTMTTPKYSSKEESKVATSTKNEGRPRRPPPYIPPQKRSWTPDFGRDNKRYPNYKTSKYNTQ